MSIVTFTTNNQAGLWAGPAEELALLWLQDLKGGPGVHDFLLSPEGEEPPDTAGVWKLPVVRAECVRGRSPDGAQSAWLKFRGLCACEWLPHFWRCPPHIGGWGDSLHEVATVCVHIWKYWLSITHGSLQMCHFKNDFPHETIYVKNNQFWNVSRLCSRTPVVTLPWQKYSISTLLLSVPTLTNITALYQITRAGPVRESEHAQYNLPRPSPNCGAVENVS